jgi:hypothetical protein
MLPPPSPAEILRAVQCPADPPTTRAVDSPSPAWVPSDMDVRKPLWVALSICAVALIGCGVFFALQDLGTANDYATVASFFLALITAVGSVVSFVHSKHEAMPTHDEAAQRRQGSGGTIFTFGPVGMIGTGKSRIRARINMPSQEPKVSANRKRR